MTLENLLSETRLTKGIPDVIAFGAGMTKGYCDATGVSITPILNYSLLIAPTVIQTAVGAYTGVLEAVSDEDNESCAPFVVKRGLLRTVIGAIETALGYCIGYTAGKIL